MVGVEFIKDGIQYTVTGNYTCNGTVYEDIFEAVSSTLNMKIAIRKETILELLKEQDNGSK